MKKTKKIKKSCIVVAFTMVACMSFGQAQFEQPEDTKLISTLGTISSTVATQYWGYAKTTIYTKTALAEEAPIWKIKKYVFNATGNPTSISVARPTSGELYGNVWTNRVNLTYY